jgi:hypothetical protein
MERTGPWLRIGDYAMLAGYDRADPRRAPAVGESAL